LLTHGGQPPFRNSTTRRQSNTSATPTPTGAGPGQV
jgi:hypothetical protein